MLKFRFLVIAFFLIFNMTFAQPCDGPGCGNDVDTPISGVEILMALGGLLGAKKAFDLKKKK